MKHIDDLIVRVLSGVASKEELQELETWIQASPENDRIYQDLLTYWHQNSAASKKVGKVIWQKVDAKLPSSDPISEPPARVRPFTAPRYRWAAVAAAVVLFLGVWWWNPLVEVDPNAPIALKEQYNPPGKRSEVLLPDGSKVWLNADSKLSFPKEFSSDARVVYLSGEAFFEVESDKSRPFSVVSGELQTTATGTAFNVKAFPEAEQIEVALVSGVVSVGSVETAPATEEVQLLPGEQLTYLRGDRSVSKDLFDEAAPYAWTKGLIYFDGAQVEEVVEELGRWYDIEFRISQENDMRTLLRHRFDANGKSLEVVLEEIARVADYQFVREKDTIWVQPK